MHRNVPFHCGHTLYITPCIYFHYCGERSIELQCTTPPLAHIIYHCAPIYITAEKDLFYCSVPILCWHTLYITPHTYLHYCGEMGREINWTTMCISSASTHYILPHLFPLLQREVYSTSVHKASPGAHCILLRAPIWRKIYCTVVHKFVQQKHFSLEKYT